PKSFLQNKRLTMTTPISQAAVRSATKPKIRQKDPASVYQRLLCADTDPSEIDSPTAARTRPRIRRNRVPRGRTKAISHSDAHSTGRIKAHHVHFHHGRPACQRTSTFCRSTGSASRQGTTKNSDRP